jgi:hypothetical protein
MKPETLEKDGATRVVYSLADLGDLLRRGWSRAAQDQAKPEPRQAPETLRQKRKYTRRR